jgi:8-oxo-dGTP pyrophosphatase MutT (NUDIX family)
LVNYDVLQDALTCGDRGAGAAPAGHRENAVCLLLFESPDTTVLSILKTDSEGYPWRDDVALPGGRIESEDGGAAGAALRELHEELGIPPSHVDVLGSLGHFQTRGTKNDLEVIVARWTRRSTLRIDPREVAQVLKLPLSDLAAFHKRAGFHERSAPDLGDELIYELTDARVWGVTARILHDFLDLISKPGIVERG